MSVAADGSAAPPAQPVVGQHPTTGGGGGAGETVHTPAGEPCPLCGAPLDPEQEWCLRCGAAARTRLATSPNWKAPIIALAVVAALSLGVIAAALVKLAGDSGSAATPATTTVTTALPAVAPTTTQARTPRVTTPRSTTPSATSGELSKKPKVTPPKNEPGQLLVNDLITGRGAEAKTGETVTVNYVGVLFHGGEEFDSSWKRGTHFTFTLGTGQVIVGWNQGVPGMKVGGRRELAIPAEYAYGAKGFPTPVPIPPNETLVFVVDLLEISKSPAPTSTHTSLSPAQKKRFVELEGGVRGSRSPAEVQRFDREIEELLTQKSKK